MLKTLIKKGSYQDSVVLMLLTNELSAMDGVNKVSIMMATPANKDIFKAGGLETDELMQAGANDMAIVADVEREAVMEKILGKTEAFLNDQSAKGGQAAREDSIKSWDQALCILPDANLAVISIPGAYAALEADRALDEGLNVFIFSDNVSQEDEKALKEKARRQGLLVMGPDCGTGIISGVPIAFTNYVSPGKIGIIGASGTGIQEVATIIDRLGAGVTNAVGTGGRDLSTAIGGITMMDAISAMEQDHNTEVLVVISKPPAKEIRDRIVERLGSIKKPVVSLFLGEKPEVHEEGFYHAYTLDEAARIAVALVRGKAIAREPLVSPVQQAFVKTDKKTIKGYYSGGTLAAEAAMMINDTLQLNAGIGKEDGYMLNCGGHMVLDLGDDIYTRGKPHPMIDPAKRTECMKNAAADPNTGVILFDVVLGYGSHENMAGALLPAIRSMKETAGSRKVYLVANICGTKKDIQNYDLQVKLLEGAGVTVCESNKKAVAAALYYIGYPYIEAEKEVLPKVRRKSVQGQVSEQVRRLLSTSPVIINIGLQSFASVLRDLSCEVVQYDWTPPAGGDVELIKILKYLREYRFS